MASLGSRPLLLEALNGGDGGPVPLQSGLTYGGRSAIFRGNVDIASGSSCRVRFPARRASSGVSVGVENGKGIRATKKVGNPEGESDAGDGGDPNSAPAIVYKSRQVLSMQDFVKQIQFDERSNQVSLFVSTSVEDKKSSTRFTRTYNVNRVSTESFTNGMHNGSAASNGSVQSTETKTPRTQHVDTPRNSTGETNINEDSPLVERPSVDAKSATDTTIISSTGLVLPKKEYTEQTVGAKPNHTDSEATASSEDKDVDASPLAGLNVMNVILIAGECAPWSKTGGLGDVAGALPKALARRGHRVMDMYDFMALDSPSTPRIDRGIALHKMIRLLTMGLGGEGYLNFMGNEFGHPEWIDFPRVDQHLPNGKIIPGNDGSFDKCRRRFDLGDADYLRYRGMQEFDRAMQLLEEEYGFMISEHQYISRKDEGDKMIVFERGNLVFVFNFHWKNSYFDYGVGCLKPAKYKVVLDSDDKLFVGFGRIDHTAKFFSTEGVYDNRLWSFTVYAPSRTVVVYAPSED